MNTRNCLTAAAVLGAVALSFAACSTDISKSNQVLARVGDREITSAYFERQVADLPEGVREASLQGEGKKAIVEGLVDREIIYGAAVKKKLDKSVDLNRKFEDLKKELVIKTYLENELGDRVKVEDAEVQAYYNNHPAEYQRREEVRVSQIVVADEARAQEILEKLSIKREFGELATSYSTDQGSAARQGDVGWFSYAKLPAEVRDGIFRLANGEVSKPFKTAGGYEIYKVTDRRTLSFPLEKVRDAIRAQIFAEKSQKEVKAVVEGLKKDVVVQYNEQLLK
jgi:peptidyl-prolyl cis-trans isomerase C